MTTTNAFVANLFLITTATLLSISSIAHTPGPLSADQLQSKQTKPILADLKDLEALGFPILMKDEVSQVGFTHVTPLMEQRLQIRAHQNKKCGGFEDLSFDAEFAKSGAQVLLKNLAVTKQKEDFYLHGPVRPMAVERNVDIDNALLEINENNLKATVQWLSSFPDRFNKSSTPNRHVTEMQSRLQELMKNSKIPYEVSLISHQSTAQKSIRVRLLGQTRPQEIIVLGGHLDSINQSWGGGTKIAPGADDNASGSANILEVLRIVSQKQAPQRTLDFFWYAGEESGLLGSAEIAKTYKANKQNVIAVLQLDMTLFPGAGELTIGSMTDFTSAWLRDYLKAINPIYLKAQISEDQCGYGCSDHASWFRQGYPTLMPFEATMNSMNEDLHTPQDVITPKSSFSHSVMFTKLALVFAMDLANSDIHQPYQ